MLAFVLGDGATGRPVACGCAEQGLLGHRAQYREEVGGSGSLVMLPARGPSPGVVRFGPGVKVDLGFPAARARALFGLSSS